MSNFHSFKDDFRIDTGLDFIENTAEYAQYVIARMSVENNLLLQQLLTEVKQIPKVGSVSWPK